VQVTLVELQFRAIAGSKQWFPSIGRQP